MKKLHVHLLCVLLSSILLVSCAKTEDIEKSNNSDGTARILMDFKSLLTAKSPDFISIDSAEWKLEGLLNFELANNSHLVENLAVLRDTVYVNTSQNLIQISELYATYLQLTNTISTLVSSDTIIDAIDLDLSNVLSTQSQVAFYVNVSFGPEIQEERGQYPTVGSTDYWWAALGAGKCGSYIGQNIGTDAMDKLQYSFNHPTGRVIYNYYYTNVVVIMIIPNSLLYSSNPWGNYMMWRDIGYDDNDCLSPDEINYYISYFPYIRDLYCPSEKQYINTEVEFGMVMVPFGDPHDYFHMYNISYGIPHLQTPPTN